jgi:glycosyltransferase involved in cell wall biosynthesis
VTNRRGDTGTVGVSVVIPVKDDLIELRRCLADLADQTVAPSEIIVVDNASSVDVRSPAIAAGARVLEQSLPGIAVTAATGYDAARYPIIARCDADSRLAPDWIERLVDAMQADGVVAVTGPGVFYEAGPSAERLSRLYLGAYRSTVATALGHAPLFGSNMAIRTSAWKAIRADVHLRADIHDDMDLSFHLGELGRIEYRPEISVGISADALRSARRVRLSRGLRSVLIHWPHDLPPLRWARRVGRALRPQRSAAGGAGER